MKRYDEHSGKTVRLTDVLALLDERVEVMTAGLVKGTDIDTETLRQKLGKIQGMQLALDRVLNHFGATQ